MNAVSKTAIWWSVPWMYIGGVLFWFIGVPLRGIYTGWVWARKEIDGGLDE